MSKSITIHKGRTNEVLVSLGYDVSGDTLTSEIRTEKDPTSDLLATFNVVFVTTGVDGELVLKLDNSSFTPEVLTHSYGYMDLKRVRSGEPYSVFAEPVEVVFQGTVTA
jgi:hypothetical protein